MARKLMLMMLVALAACSKGPEADLQSIGEARSAAAEWALVNEQAGRGHLTGPYVASMHERLRDDLSTSLSSLTQPNSPYGQEIQALLAQPDDAGAQQLRAHARKLKQIEDSLESN